MAKNSSYLLTALLIILSGTLYLKFSDYIISAFEKRFVLNSLECEGESQSSLSQVAYYAIDELNYKNLQLSYVDDADNISSCTAGWADMPYLSPKVDIKTRFNYASVTKVFTSELILDLVRRQQIKLDDKLVDLLDLTDKYQLQDERVAKITVADLLSHRAGFDRNITPDSMITANPWCPYHMAHLQAIKLDFDPNSKNVYSNIGYCLLSQVIESHYQDSYISTSEEYFGFKNNDIGFLQRQPEAQPNVPFMNQTKQIRGLDFYALSAVGGLSGTSVALAEYIHTISKRKYPNITDRPKNINCDKKQVRGCHGFAGYEYAPKTSTLYWRNGRLPNTNALMTVDNRGNVITFLSNTDDPNSWLSKHEMLVKFIYKKTTGKG
ncbi:hypothetical protein CAP50_01805 [Psychrobacter sp. L7]|uniref:serine hydrolase domain-containing protein n=1 Tax=Psychrobacter sp. L7 TaxID=1982756 RepID=UPI000C2A7FC0|nr:serine hydrolase domain-containing protein [Psychrobacter sp. L7]PJX27267.1 hypothetical protein CAP50_01805 [Psychrobacter sp. L7]